MQLEAQRVSLSKLLGTSGEQFRVPPYQRPYAWGAEQIDDLWDDLINAEGRGHFLGSLVFSDEREDRPEIIDGQQRLTTLVLLLSLIRDEYDAVGSKYAERVQSLMFSDAWADGDAKFKLRLGESNWRLFRDLALRPPSDPKRLADDDPTITSEERSRNGELIDNLRRLRERLTTHLGGTDGDERLRRLERLEDTILKRVELVAIRVGTIGDAFLLFETLNDRGLKLSAADLLKNHLLSKVAEKSVGDEEVQRVGREWDAMLDDLGRDVDIVRFFRHFLLVRLQDVSKDEVYKIFKKSVKSTDPDDLLADLRISARHYGEFEDPSRVVADEADVSAVLRDLSTLRAIRCYVTLLPARRWLPTADFVRVARTAEVLTYRYSSIAGLDAKSLEVVYHRAAKLLDESKGSELPAALELLEEAMPNSETFVAGFVRQSMGVQYLLRYTLRRIEEHLAPATEKEIKPATAVHLEHIMPVVLSEQWRTDLGAAAADYREWVNRWGNLTLLLSSLNGAASNFEFAKKKKYYMASEVELTRRLAELGQWDYAAIESRQQWLGEIADRIWSADALRGEMGALPEPSAVASSTGLGLAPAIDARVWDLMTESSFHELLEQRARILGHLSLVEIEASTHDDIDFHLAKRIADALFLMIERSAELDGEHRALVRAAVEYFVLADDVNSDLVAADGFADDAAVVDAIAQAVGLADIKVHTS